MPDTYIRKADASASRPRAFQRIKLRTRFLNDWSKRDLGTEIFGKRINLPFRIASAGSAGLTWYQGELELARAAAAAPATGAPAAPGLRVTSNCRASSSRSALR